jgi:N-acetyl-alpha-D-glucosaminyl L-malate synthase BshA
MKIGIVCYASVGGSGVVATELAHALAGRGHRVHLISSEIPFRWREGLEGLTFERVDTPAYPLFREPQYLLALANTIVRVACERELDLVHAHYAVPHATAAYLAEQILSADGAAGQLRTVTTLHGTDITLVGSDPSYQQVVAFSIERSHGVTAVSESLRRDTIATLGIRQPIRVIPNFLDCEQYRRRPDAALERRLAPAGEAVVMHVSNFRPVKRVHAVLDVFMRIARTVPARLVLVGDGPDRAGLEERVMRERLGASVMFAGEQQDLVSWLSSADLFLLPSSQESFGMAALEAMACAVPVVASRVGGLPEVIADGETGFLREPDDLDGMAECGIAVLRDRAEHERIAAAAAVSVRTRFCAEVIVPMYEACYREVLDASRAPA